MDVTIIIEVSDDAPTSLGANTVPLTLHEALCKSIHEKPSRKVTEWLGNNVLDIRMGNE